jgi:hypothetical protein
MRKYELIKMKIKGVVPKVGSEVTLYGFQKTKKGFRDYSFRARVKKIKMMDLLKGDSHYYAEPIPSSRKYG